MDNRERIIRLWFDMWLAKKDLGIFDVFSDNAVYIESWGPEYHGIKKIILWFEEWNTRGTVLQWDIKQFFHKDNQTIVEWYFKNKMDDGNVEAFDGISLIEWTPDDKIALLKEFGCNENRYDPYDTNWWDLDYYIRTLSVWCYTFTKTQSDKTFFYEKIYAITIYICICSWLYIRFCLDTLYWSSTCINSYSRNKFR